VNENLTEFLYLVAIVTFILALRFLSSPKRARLGNQVGAAGMALAIVVTLAQDLENYKWIVLAMAIGAVIGVVGARRVKMTAMPQMVALFNGVGGGAVALIALAEFHNLAPAAGRLDLNLSLAMIISAIIGSISFAGSLIAFAKLQELIGGRPIVYPGQKPVNALVIAAALGLAAAILVGPESQWLLVGVIVSALTFGVLFVLPIGGADMPVVISLLNACTGLAASAAGFALHENILIVSGALVGASGTLLTLLMGRAMNRSITNVLFGAFGQIQTGTGAALEEGRTARTTTPDDVAIMLSYARRVVIVPGYGLAVAQAQHDVRALGELLEEKGVDVRYAIHPVAGRMPGHMNVLLAEANVPYDKLFEMDEINPELPQTDVAVVVGANDVVNPSARTDPTSPIYGMPIIEVDKAAQVVVVKRSLAPGFAGIDNPLFYNENTSMLFADAKVAFEQLLVSVKNL
jgi:H+-translocating NAD(P) transhydrogenase subunit beta